MNTTRKKIVNHRAMFRRRTKKDDNNELSMDLIISTRKTGKLDLSGKGLYTVPDRVWNINDYTEDELKKLCAELDFTIEKQNWWEQESLKSLDLSANSLTTIDSKVKNLADLVFFDLHDNLIQELPDDLGYLSKLQKLDLSYNKLKNLPCGVVKLTELKILDLNNNILEDLNSAISDLVMLESMNLSCNNLTTLPIGLGYLVRLVYLNLSHNLLKELPPDITSMRALKTLDVSFNHLESLPYLGELRKMEVLILHTNNLKTFPDVTGCLALRELHLSNNNIEEIDVACLQSIGQLKVLTLKSNQIELIPEEIVQLINMEQFDLSYNKLSTIPNFMGIMPNLHNFNIVGNNLKNIRRDIVQCGTWRVLKHLRQNINPSNIETHDSPFVSDNSTEFPDKYMMRNAKLLSLIGRNLSQIPDSVFDDAQQAEVTCIDLSKNKFCNLPDTLGKVETVTDLKLSCNQLISLPDWMGGKLVRLQFLDLNKNRLNTLPPSIGSLEYLREINISFNRFIELPECISSINHLEILIANDNQIAEINIQILEKLKKLAILDLSNNNIAFVPPELGNLRNLRNLSLSGNCFKQPRQATLMKGTDEILAYLRNRIPTSHEKIN